MEAASLKPTKHAVIAAIAILAIIAHLTLRALDAPGVQYPLYAALILGGAPLVWELFLNLIRFEFGSDLLAGMSIVTAVILGEYLAGTLVVLMLSGGGALEAYAIGSASSVLQALAKRMPSIAHRQSDSTLEDIPLDDVEVGDRLVVLPHEVCPVDGIVLEGHSAMDESYLTGEPYVMSKTPGAQVISGAINGEAALTIRAEKRPIDSRYAKIMEVMRASEQKRPRMRRLADNLGAFYTPLALAVAITAWVLSGEAMRFLAVLVVATPCPLLIAVPVAIIGSISLAAKRSIIIRDPLVLERAPRCRTMILDKTGTLTYGKPQLIDEHTAPGVDKNQTLALAASLEQYSKHPLASAVVSAARARKLALREASHMSEPPGQGLQGDVQGRHVRITSRARLAEEQPEVELPPQEGGLECVVMLDGAFAALYRFRDAPRSESQAFIGHLGPRHGIERVMLVSGDREAEVQYLADQVGIDEIHANQSPEQKVAIVEQENKLAHTIFVGDGVNDAPALMTAHVGVALGTANDVTIEAAGAVIMDNSLERVDELLHISHRMRKIALQSAVGGMALSIICMLIAAAGYLPPVAGALVQEAIDVIVVVNALRVAIRPGTLTDF